MLYCGLDVSLKQTALCVVDGDGRVVREAKLATDPEVISRFLQDNELGCERIGLEAGGRPPGYAWNGSVAKFAASRKRPR
ncbi:hypothetical protein ACFQU7_40080 [Pseudoroseomonas wenyumeiae]